MEIKKISNFILLLNNRKYNKISMKENFVDLI